MSQPHEPRDQSEADRSRNPFVRFQKGFERRFNRTVERYGALLERVIAHRNSFVMVSLAIALGSLSLFFFLGRDYFPEIRSGVIQMHMRAPIGTRIEVSGRIATLVSRSIQELLPGQVENIVSNCGLPVGPHNLAFIPTPTIGSQDCDLTILLKDEKSPVWEYRTLLRRGLKERYPGTEFTFQPSDLTAQILNFGALHRSTCRSTARTCIPTMRSPSNWRASSAKSPAPQTWSSNRRCARDPHGGRQPHLRARRE